MKHIHRKILALSVIYASAYLLSLSGIGFRINHTESVPYKLFLNTQFHAAKTGHYVTVKHALFRLPLAKQIVGLAGDEIALRDCHIFVNEYDCGLLLTHTSTGLALSPIEPGVIPEGYLFVSANHPNSFDSRYKEFGLIKLENIEEQLWPLL